MIMKKRTRTLSLVLILAAFLLAGTAGAVLYIKHSGVKVESSIDYVPDSVVYYYQKDPAWKEDPLNKNEEPVPLSAFGDRIFSVRYISH